MTEFGKSGYGYSQGKNGIVFQKKVDGDVVSMSPEEFAAEFGSAEVDETARQQAARILDGYNRKYRTNFTLPPAPAEIREGPAKPMNRMA